MPEPSSYDAVIIGAGVIGACTAYELAKRGWKTLSVDKLPQAGYGSTSGSCAIIRTYYSTLETCALAYEGWHYWSNWAQYLNAGEDEDLISYRDIGCLVVKTDQNHHLQRVCAIMDQIGCPYEHIEPKDIARYMPNPDLHQFHPAKLLDDDGFGLPTGPRIDGAVFFPRGGYVNDPKLAAFNAQCAAQRRGAEFVFNRTVTGITRSGGRVSGVVLDGSHAIEAPVVINVAGPHSSAINRLCGVDAGMNITTRALRHEVAHVKAPQGVDFDKQGVVYSDGDIAAYCRPEVGNNVLIGSEDPPCDEQIWVDDPDDYDDSFSDQWNVLVMRMAQRLPDLPIPSRARGTVALYDVTEDWMPIYDRSDLDGFYMAVGTSGNQFKNAPVAGGMMATLIDACENGHDHDADPVRFHLENVGLDVSMASFSRNRAINQDSSFSVIG